MARQSGSQSLIQEALDKRREWIQREKLSQSSQDADIDDVREKYELQNKSLAKTNALMNVKINEMENKIGELINDNMKLRQSQPTTNYHEILEVKLQQLEDKLTSKVNDIYEILKSFRTLEGLRDRDLKPGAKSSGLGMYTSLLESRGQSPAPCQSNSLPPETTPSQPEPLSISQPDSGQSSLQVPSQLRGQIRGKKYSLPKRLQVRQDEPEVSPTPTNTIIEESNPVENVMAIEQPQVDPKAEIRAKKSSKPRRSDATKPTSNVSTPPINKRSTRRRSEVDYSEPSLNKKLRRDRAELIDAVTEHNYKRPVKNNRVALSQVTNNNTNKPKPKPTTKKINDNEGHQDIELREVPQNRRYTYN